MTLRRFTHFGYLGGLVLGVGLVLLYGAMEVSSTPVFCGSCHVMAPYYESWETSTHAQIACVECHIPPGITAELEKKYEALSMVVRYFTGTYGTNPWAEIDDAACLECHDRRLLSGRELFGDVLFDHGPHLAELRRGKRLRCTSCHSQIVQGSHITVTSTSCILCHFKNQEPATGTARCVVCHQAPEGIVDAQGLAFDHGDVARFGMACESCHAPARPDEGRVPRERCVTCHADPARLAEYDATDLLHQKHVTDHKVECTDCHLEIRHVGPPHVEAAESECDSCHQAGHSPQRNLYAGIGGKGVEPMPDVMFRAGVRCEGCHFDATLEASKAGEVACMSCHGPAYRKLYLSWSETLRRRTQGLRRQVDDSARLLDGDPAFAQARDNLELVERGRGIHNVPYSLRLLAASHGQLNTARQNSGLGALSIPWPEAPFESGCFDCHVGAETRTVSVFGRRFPHQAHVVGKGLDCRTCHTSHEERAAPGVEPLRFGAEGCASCHHGDAARACADCHGAISERGFETELGEFQHSFHVDDLELACADCHGEGPAVQAIADREVCAGCH